MKAVAHDLTAAIIEDDQDHNPNARWVGTAEAGRRAGVTARTVRYWEDGHLIRSKRESRKKQARRAKLWVWLPDVMAQAALVGTKHRLPANFWQRQKPEAPESETPKPETPKPQLPDLDALLDPPISRTERDALIYAAAWEFKKDFQEAVRRACVDAEDFDDLPDVASYLRELITAEVAKAKAVAETRVGDAAELKRLRAWTEEVKKAVNG